MLSYESSGGLADQLRSLVIARGLAEALNRTLVLPPLYRHFEARRKVGTVPHVKLSALIDSTALRVPVLDAAVLPNTEVLRADPPGYACEGSCGSSTPWVSPGAKAAAPPRR